MSVTVRSTGLTKTYQDGVRRVEVLRGIDLDVEFAVTEKLSVAIGSNNVLDEYPDLSSADIGYFGNLPYDVLQPITFNGAFYYLRTIYSFL